jgi:hypothetical protein
VFVLILCSGYQAKTVREGEEEKVRERDTQRDRKGERGREEGKEGREV